MSDDVPEELMYLTQWNEEENKTDFTKEDIIGLRAFFIQTDRNCDGFLSKDEFKCFLDETTMDSRFLDAIFRIFDKEGKGLTFSGFLSFFDACLQTEKHPTYFFKLIFDSVDVDHNGEIDKDEMLEFTKLCGRPLSKKQIDDEINKIDSNGNGMVDFGELCQALHLIKTEKESSQEKGLAFITE
jgi:Ca2+-binding EF-hand superfamily protein